MYLHRSKKKKIISTCFDADFPVSLLVTYSLLIYLFCMWLSTNFHWWTFLSSSIQKEENNFYLFRCWFPCKSTGYVQSLNIFILHVIFNNVSFMNIFIFIDPKRRKEFLPILMLISLLLITYSALSVSQHIYFACEFQQIFIDENFYLHQF